MKQIYTVGLGEPEPVGKRALFKPSKEGRGIANERGTRKRLRTTIELSVHALAITQELQNRHRLATGKVLPLWKLICQAIEYYGKSTHENDVESFQ